MKSPKHWTIRVIDGKACECYCCINSEYVLKHNRFSYRLVSVQPWKSIPVVNTHYEPRVKKPRKPLYCRKKPSEHCYKNNCPHFAYAEYTGE